ncbi:hypothetical protein ACR6C2_40080 [Streptomyces sp. INA 01156]
MRGWSEESMLAAVCFAKLVHVAAGSLLELVELDDQAVGHVCIAGDVVREVVVVEVLPLAGTRAVDDAGARSVSYGSCRWPLVRMLSQGLIRLVFDEEGIARGRFTADPVSYTHDRHRGGPARLVGKP